MIKSGSTCRVKEFSWGKLMNTLDIICAGEMLIDFTPGEKPWNYTANPGGAPANVAIAAARNEIKTGFLGVLGRDDFGRMLADTLKKDGVELLCPELTDKATTTLAFVTLYEGGERSFTFVRNPGADILLSPEDVWRAQEAIANCMIFHAGSFSMSAQPGCKATEEGIRLAHENKKLVSFDVNYRHMVWGSMEKCLKCIEEVLPMVDLLKISDEELFFVGGEENIPAFMEKYRIAVVVETLGSQGAKFFFGGKSVLIGSRKVEAVDATGAGDAFWGGFLSKLLLSGVESVSDITEELLRSAVTYGNAAGGLCVQKFGGIPALPTREEIEECV